MERILDFIEQYIPISAIPQVGITDVVEVIIIAFVIYKVMTWLRTTRATFLLRGIAVIVFFCLIAYFFHMNTILFLLKAGSYVAITVVVIVFQPELRRALEDLGQQDLLQRILFNGESKTSTGITDRTINEITRACYEMGKVRTGALIVVERKVSLREFERTGIALNAIVSKELLINIFEHNTPLHDGAVIISGNLVAAATSYLPLSTNGDLSKDLGTRHRAAVGVSESTDSITVVVSEETGDVSIAMEGKLFRNVEPDFVKEHLALAIEKESKRDSRLFKWKNKVKEAEK